MLDQAPSTPPGDQEPPSTPPGDQAPPSTTFATRLREAKGLRSNRWIARTTGIARESVIRLLRGDIECPRLSTTRTLAKALGVSWQWLAGDS